jgi:hypothetical protein
MNKKDEALRITARFLLAGYFGKPFTRQEMKTMADLCSLALPMKYRMEKADFVALQTSEESIAACARETQHAQVKGTGFCRCTHAMFS